MRLFSGTILFLIPVLAQTGGCSNGAPTPEGTSRSQLGAEATPSAGISAEDAKRLAQTHLALRKAGWGEPESVAERDGKFYVGYQTPERELRLLGPRILLVDKQTGVVTVQKRR